MQVSVLLYDIMTFIYAVAVLLYFVDFIHPNLKANRFAFGLVFAVWIIQSVFFIMRMLELNYVPILTTFETMIFFSWILITFSLVINFFYKIDLFTFFTNVAGFAAVAFVTFTYKGATSLAASLQGNLLVLHISMALLSYACFLLATIFSIMYLIQEKLLKEKRWNDLFRRLPSLDQLEQFSHRLVVFGFPLLLTAMILGAIWYNARYDEILILDPKPVVSLLVLVNYGISIYLRVSAGWLGRRLAWINITGFVGVVINYLIVGEFFSDFHNWR
ncbi:cytochrome C assembly family protein [Effusibacillus lacus]|uniref:Cytochrome c assembly protein n=1 Tax=Effusibacillus lacus TaxID=1348429 RepID=A0A292YPT3_9BACL|nr:cytochrome c biogenesis protein CcsA [Effusibacillus lacus]TCS76472.1 HemX protein [Effusibacillus lacus]GAX90505.1 cytochrome c assembly protein [Effusibacillus lacus]